MNVIDVQHVFAFVPYRPLIVLRLSCSPSKQVECSFNLTISRYSLTGSLIMLSQSHCRLFDPNVQG